MREIAAPAKPPFGSPCNHCGLCCRESLCILGHAKFGTWEGPCPALIARQDGSSACGLIEAPEVHAPALVAIAGREKLKKAAALLNGAGMGCDAKEVGERVPVTALAAMLAKFDQVKHGEFNAALRAWQVNARTRAGRKSRG